jgi:hypothetical protein
LLIAIALWPVPVAARSKAQVYSSLPAENVGSNPARGMDVCCVCIECCQVEVCVLSGRGLSVKYCQVEVCVLNVVR